MQGIVVFHSKTPRWFNRYLKIGFWHVFLVVQDDHGYWVRIDARCSSPCVEVVAPSEFAAHNLIDLYEAQGFIAKELRVRQKALPILMVGSCVGLVKAWLGIRNPFVVTPWQLYKYLWRE